MRGRMALSKYDSTRGTTNLARIARAILGPCDDLLRDVLTKEISPPDLKRELNKYLLIGKKPPISQKQIQLVNNGYYSEFDISLLYFLLRNTCSIPPHTKGWGNPPDPTDKSVSANIERIRFLRNEWGHSTNLSLSDSDFEQSWKNIFKIVKDLEGYLGTGTMYQKALNNLKTCCMDPERDQYNIQRLLIVEQLENDVNNLKEEVNQIKMHVMIEPACPKESTLELDTFKQWQDDIALFVSTRACKKVENKVNFQNLVIVAGHSGYGKSTIIKHIALEYRRQGWIVKLVTEVTEIINVYSLNQFLENRTIFILEDPIGKEAYDEIAISSWRIHEEKLKICLKKVKLLLSCRKHVLSNYREKGLLKDKSNIVDINSDQLKLNFQEKVDIWKSHATHKDCLHIDILQGLFQIDAYFPLLCKLFFDNQNYQKMGIRFFKEVDAVLVEDIRSLKKTCKETYCALVLLALYNNVICVSDLLEIYISEEKYQRALQLCGIPDAWPSTIMESLEFLNGLFVKKIGDNFHFYHDLFMEVTTFVFGSEFPTDIIKYADIGFLRKRVKIKNSDEQNDPHIIYLKHKHNELGKRLFSDFFGERLLDVIFNPCLRDDKVIQAFLEELEKHPDPEKIEMLLKIKNLHIQQEFYKNSKGMNTSKLALLNLEKGISPLNALIIFCHTKIIMHCLNTLQNWQKDLKVQFLFSSVCCNGSLDLFKMFSKDDVKGFFIKEKWGPFYPVHIASQFHNFEILRELMSLDNDMNSTTYNTANIRTSNIGRWTPLILAAITDIGESDENKENSNEKRRNETINVLLSNKAEINICDNEGTSALYIACQEKYESTVKLLLHNGADANLLDRNGTSPLYAACQEGYEKNVKLLLDHDANINLLDEDGVGPLFIACQEGYDNIVKLLLSKGADIDLHDKKNTSPLFVACQEGHDCIIEL